MQWSADIDKHNPTQIPTIRITLENKDQSTRQIAPLSQHIHKTAYNKKIRLPPLILSMGYKNRTDSLSPASAHDTP
jgi:hypothetical protein